MFAEAPTAYDRRPLGVAPMGRLRAHPEAQKLAGGRR